MVFHKITLFSFFFTLMAVNTNSQSSAVVQQLQAQVQQLEQLIQQDQQNQANCQQIDGDARAACESTQSKLLQEHREQLNSVQKQLQQAETQGQTFQGADNEAADNFGRK